MKNLRMFIGIGIYFCSLALFAHGENQPGPNGGKIKMPGAFHTEVLDYKRQGFKIYLLDISFKNPLTKSSKVKAKLILENSERNLRCSTHPDHFYCEDPSGKMNYNGLLELETERNGLKGIPVRYKLPLMEN